jgi:signal recognition particle GTPase
MEFELDSLQEDNNCLTEANKNLVESYISLESKFASLKELSNKYHEQLLDTRHDLVQKDYQVQNQEEIIKQLGKTLVRYEKENKALRQLVELWI